MLRIAHIALSISNLEKTIAFYKNNFGLKCREKLQIESAGLKIAILKKGDVSLELFEFKRHKPLPIYRKDLDSDLKTIGAKHFAFAVADIGEEYKRLKKSGVHFATDMRTLENGLRYFFIKDPDGIFIEIIEEGNR